MNIKDELAMMSGVTTRTEALNKRIDESVMLTITRPLMSGKALQAFNAELKRWQEAGFLQKWQKNRLFSKVKLYISGIDEPYIINITNIMGVDPDDKGSKKEKLKNRLVGKVKSPYRWFQTFKQIGFYEIVEKLFDMIEEDVEKEKPRPDAMEDAEWDKKEEEFYKMLATAKKKMQVFRKIDSGDFQLNIGMNAGNMTEGTFEDLLKNPDNDAYEGMNPNFALVNLTSGEIYEISPKNNFDDDVSEFDPDEDDKVVVLDVKKNKKIKTYDLKKKDDIDENTLEEMAKADFEGIDLSGTPESIATQYISNYKKRTGKEFTPQAVAAFKKGLPETVDVEKAVAKAREIGKVAPPKTHAERSKKASEVSKTKKAAKKEAGEDVPKGIKDLSMDTKGVNYVDNKGKTKMTESIFENIRSNSGIQLNEFGYDISKKKADDLEEIKRKTLYNIKAIIEDKHDKNVEDLVKAGFTEVEAEKLVKGFYKSL